MIGTGVIARRYARALSKHTGTDVSRCLNIFESFNVIGELFSHGSASKILKSLSMPEALKRDLLEYVLRQVNAEPLMKDFVWTVLSQGRVQYLPEIGKIFTEMILEANDQLTAVITAAIPLDSADVEDIKNQLSKIFQKNITVKLIVDEDLLGGFIVRVGHSQLDLSLKSRLDDLTSNIAL